MFGHPGVFDLECLYRMRGGESALAPVYMAMATIPCGMSEDRSWGDFPLSGSGESSLPIWAVMAFDRFGRVAVVYCIESKSLPILKSKFFVHLPYCHLDSLYVHQMQVVDVRWPRELS